MTRSPQIKRRLQMTVAGGLLVGVLFALFVYPGSIATVTPHFAGVCRELPIEANAADLVADNARGLVYLTYLDRLSGSGGRQPHGTVMLLDLGAAAPRVRAALSTDPPGFRPIGLSLYAPGQGPPRLFVISAPASAGASSSVEIFEQTPTGAFASVETIHDTLLTNPTAIVAVGPRQFYVTNGSGARSGFARVREVLFRPASSTIAYFNGERTVTAVTGLEMASGITSSADGREIYVSETSGKRLSIFERQAEGGTLKMREQVALDSGPANLSTDDKGNVWIAAHPRLLATLRNWSDASVRAPTQVLRFNPAGRGAARQVEIYLNDGAQISAGSAAVAHGNHLVIGSDTDRRLVLCEQAP
jgi:arylesterase/paraoxonase